VSASYQAQLAARDLRDEAERMIEAASRLRGAADALERCAVSGSAETRLLGGHRLLEAVLEVVEPGERIHYQDLLGKLRDVGVEPRGKNPANTLLSTMMRASNSAARPFSRVGFRTGEFVREAASAGWPDRCKP